MLVIDATILTIAVPRIQSSLHLSVGSLTWAVNSYTLTFGGLLLLGGRAGDLWGRRRVLTAGVLLFAVASLAGSLATSGATSPKARPVTARSACMVRRPVWAWRSAWCWAASSHPGRPGDGCWSSTSRRAWLWP
jgi:MFS family permease